MPQAQPQIVQPPDPRSPDANQNPNRDVMPLHHPPRAVQPPNVENVQSKKQPPKVMQLKRQPLALKRRPLVLKRQPQDGIIFQEQPPATKRRPPNGSQAKSRPPRANQCQEQPPELPPDPDPSKLQERLPLVLKFQVHRMK